jgi:FXSXX-COOH protein
MNATALLESESFTPLSPTAPLDSLAAQGSETLNEALHRILPGSGDGERLEVAAFNSSI